MASLQARLDRMRASSEAKFPSEALTIMHRATHDLEASGAAARALGEGGTLPVFELPNQNGDKVSLKTLLTRGPLILTFFRGHW